MGSRSQQVGPLQLSVSSPPHTINVTVDDHFSILQQTVWNQGIWSKAIWSRPDDGNRKLTLTGTDVFGTLPFEVSGGSDDKFTLVFVSVDNTVPWLDLQLTCDASHTGALILQRYDNKDTTEGRTMTLHNKIASTTASDGPPGVTVQSYTVNKNLKDNAESRGVIVTIN
jgi:hypothetical protein